MVHAYIDVAWLMRRLIGLMRARVSACSHPEPSIAHGGCARVLATAHVGDGTRKHVLERMAADDLADLRTAQALPQAQATRRAAIVVCHSMPSNYAVPDPAYFAGEQCPPDPKRRPPTYTQL